MKKNYTLILMLLFYSICSIAQQTQSNFINYQGVARTAENQLMANETMVVGIDLKIGGAAESPTYSENHSITTDANGVFSLKIGNGDLVSGGYDTYPWGDFATFVTVSINGAEVGTTEMTAVPYALSSGDGAQQADEVPYDNSVSGLSANNTQDAIDELVGSGTIDADSDATNELQNLNFNAATNELSLTDGNTVTIPSGGTDADADPTNEIQTLSFDAGTNELSLSDGNAITIPSGGTDADADPTNEIQTISFDVTSNEISLTDGGTITIPSGGTDADPDPTNEIQTISFDAVSNEISLTDGGTITIPSGGTDADADPTNEFQTLSFDATTNELSLTDGNAITIPSGGTDADPDPTNELQDLSLAGTELTISDGSTIDLAPIVTPGGSDDQNLVLTGDILSIESGTGSVDLNDYRNDADFDPNNELQDLSLVGTELTISDGSTIDLAPIVPPGGSDDQNLVLTGDVLTIERGTDNIDLSVYRDRDITTQNGILLGNGTTVTGLIATADGQIPKWNAATNTWISATDATGGSGGAQSLDDLVDAKVAGASLFIGQNSGDSNTGNSNTATGFETLKDNTTGEFNTANGAGALQSNTTGRNNTANGFNALVSNTTGGRNTANGFITLYNNTTGVFNTATGDSALLSNTTGSNNSAYGASALFRNTTGYLNTANGVNALNENTTGSENTATGVGALRSNTTGAENTANGADALQRNTTGAQNTANGVDALFSNTTGNNNTANGKNALFSNTTGAQNTANGVDALFSNTIGNNNTANGKSVLSVNTTGSFNTANGAFALSSNTTGSFNTANGTSALGLNTIGNDNTANGKDALRRNSTGSFNTAIGIDALRSNTTGSNNTAIGGSALSGNTTGNNNIGLGSLTQVPSAAGSNQVRIGNSGITYAGIQVAWTVTSDARWKEEVQDLPYGLNMVSQLRPVDYKRKNNELHTHEIGFIAQEVEEVLAQLGYKDQGILTKDDEGYMSLRYNDFIPVLTKAIQEQQDMITSLQNEQESFQSQLAALKTQLTDLVNLQDKKDTLVKK